MKRFGLPCVVLGLVTACGSSDEFALREIPEVETYCLEAQRVVTRTLVPMRLEVHDDFDAFVKSKAVIEGPTIQQFNWYDEEGQILGISCKLKSADHLNLEFGEGAAGPDGACQDMNRQVFERISRHHNQPAFRRVSFDPSETVSNDEEPGMTGPDWLAPYQAVRVDADGTLVIKAKGFQVDFTDERFVKAPPRFRGVHYCHFVAPALYERLLAGTAEPDVSLGRAVVTRGTRPESPDQPAN